MKGEVTQVTVVERPAIVQLISARHDIRFGEKITMEMLATQEWPAESAPENTFSSVTQVVNAPGERDNSQGRTFAGRQGFRVWRDRHNGSGPWIKQPGNRGGATARTITVEVAPKQGQLLALAQRVGALSLTLRTERDVSDTDLGQVSLDDLMRNADPIVVKTARPKAEPVRTIKVRRGTTTGVVEIQ